MVDIFSEVNQEMNQDTSRKITDSIFTCDKISSSQAIMWKT
jgi:hypothetical protein